MVVISVMMSTRTENNNAAHSPSSALLDDAEALKDRTDEAADLADLEAAIRAVAPANLPPQSVIRSST